ncbi:MAG: HAD family hydrolase [Myxococcales bacterium]
MHVLSPTPPSPPPQQTRWITIPELVDHLDARAGGDHCTLAFDGDGTLWEGDVSDDVFLAACEKDWFLPQIHHSLEIILSDHGLATTGTTSKLAYRLFEAEKQSLIDERLLFEIMTWCYAGRTADELSDFAEEVLQQSGIESRVRMGYRPLLEWAHSHEHSTWVVTASPWPIVRVAARTLGFVDDQVIASRASESAGGVLGPALAAPLPYRGQKVQRLAEKRGNSRSLAAFGDSYFDIDLLRSAEVAVAVSPKPALERELASLEHALILRL